MFLYRKTRGNQYRGDMEKQVEILICGAGPTGLMMANQLLAQNIPFVLIDKKEGPTNLSKAVGVQARTVEVFEDLSLAEKLVEKGLKLKGMVFYEKTKRIGEVLFEGIDSKYDFLLGVSQEDTEKVLVENLEKNGREILWQHELVDMQMTDVEASVKIKKMDGSLLERRFDYVIGCDGIHSIVREKAGINFTGGSLKETFGLADIELEPLPTREEGSAYLAKSGVALFFPLPPNHFRLILNDVEHVKDEKIPKEYFEKYMKDRTGVDYKIKELYWGANFFIHYKKAEKFRFQRVFLVGDAGHVHSPAGGQGMNTGLQDAYNLAWRFGMIVHKGSDESLLDGYCIEREYTAKQLLEMTEKLTTLISLKSFFTRWVRRFVISKVFTIPFVQKALRERFSQVSINYFSLSTVCNKTGNPFSRSGIAFISGPKAGERALNGSISYPKNPEITTLYDYMKGTTNGYVLLFLSDKKLHFWTKKQLNSFAQKVHEGSNKIYSPKSINKYVLVVQSEDYPFKNEWDGEVIVDKDGSLHKKYGALKPCTYVIRPDKYIAFKSPKIHMLQVIKFLLSSYKIG